MKLKVKSNQVSWDFDPLTEIQYKEILTAAKKKDLDIKVNKLRVRLYL